VYIADGFSEDVVQYDVGAGGALTPKSVSPVPAGEEAAGIAISPDGRSLYVAVYGTGSVFQYDIGAGGVLSAKSRASIPAGEGAYAIAISPDGHSLYVANDEGGEAEAISQYDIGPGGLLSPKPQAFVAAPTFGAEGIAMTPDGRNVYLAGEGALLLAQYDVGPGGTLSAKSPPSVTAGHTPWGVVATPDQGPSASFSSSAAPAGSPTTFNGAASSDPDGTVSSYSWSFGDGTTGSGAAPTHIYAVPGTYTVTLQVTDDAGCSAAEVFTGQTAYCSASGHGVASALVTVPPAPAVLAPPTTRIVLAPPKITGAHQSASRWREGHKIVQVSRRPPVGTTFSFSLNEFATVSFAFTHQIGGRRVGRHCVTQTGRNRHRPACRRNVTAATMSFPLHPGRNKLVFQGRVTHSRTLRPGRYTLIMTATNSAGAKSNRVSLTFTIVR
jgi:DNA-binding beta-propeller fold protein YncE